MKSNKNRLNIAQNNNVMKRSITVFLLLSFVLIISCKTTPPMGPEEPEYPITVGNWEIESSTKANWKGEQPRSKRKDTVTTNTSGKYLEVVYTGEERFDLIVVDESFPEDSVITLSRPILDFPEGSYEDGTFNKGGHKLDFEDGFFHVTLKMTYDCDRNVSYASESIIYTLVKENESNYYELIFPVSGFIDTVEYLVCGEPI